MRLSCQGGIAQMHVQRSGTCEGTGVFALYDMKLEVSAEPIPLQGVLDPGHGRYMIYILILDGMLCRQLKRS
jgi:hypothetical protein